MKLKLIDQFVLMPIYWRWGLLLFLCLTSGILLFQKLLSPAELEIEKQDRQLIRLKDRINWYQTNQFEIVHKQDESIKLEQQLDVLDHKLIEYKQSAPERFILDSASQVNVNPQQVKISQHQADRFGQYFRISIEVIGNHESINQFFNLLLRQEQLVVWEKLIFDQKINNLEDDKLVMSMTSRHYIEIFDDLSD